MREIKAVSHPIPTEYAINIYENGKTIFVGKSHLGRVSKGDKFVIYESHGAKAYTGWADIKSIGKQKTDIITQKYGKKLMITIEEFVEYSNNRDEMNIIEFENFEKFKNPVKPLGFVKESGKYIDEYEFNSIMKKKGSTE